MARIMAWLVHGDQPSKCANKASNYRSTCIPVRTTKPSRQQSISLGFACTCTAAVVLFARPVKANFDATEFIAIDFFALEANNNCRLQLNERQVGTRVVSDNLIGNSKSKKPTGSFGLAFCFGARHPVAAVQFLFDI